MNQSVKIIKIKKNRFKKTKKLKKDLSIQKKTKKSFFI